MSALSGDGESKAPAAVQLAVQADEAIETTTLSEGSGWDQSTNEPEAETTTENAIDAETTAAPEAETTAAPEAETTAAPEAETTAAAEAETTAAPEAETTAAAEAETTAAPEAETTLNPNKPEQETTLAPEEEQPTTTSPNGEDEQPTTTDSPIASTIAPTPPPVFQCPTPGLFAHISGNCQRFHNCLLNPVTSELLSLDMYCPPDTAFSPSYRRCGRDVAACQDDDFVCIVPGRFAGNNETYYYNCVINLKGGFHKYVVRCSGGERYEPLVRRCWRYDWSQLLPGQQSLESCDLAAIKREQKQFKAEEKLRLKELKNQEKLKRKQQKEAEKLAKKAAKEQAKKEAKANKPVSVESAESPEQSSNEI